MTNQRRLARRDFIATTAAATGLAAASTHAAGTTSSVSAPLRVGIIGVGSRAREHIDCAVHHPGLELAGLCDLRPEALAAGTQRSGRAPKTFADYEKMLADLPLDVVVISTPNHLHAGMSVAASRAGCHVLCEKPMATTVADCQAMIDAAGSAQRALLIGMQRRYSPVYSRGYELVTDGAIGEPRFMNHIEYRGDWAKKSQDPEEDPLFR